MSNEIVEVPAVFLMLPMPYSHLMLYQQGKVGGTLGEVASFHEPVDHPETPQQRITQGFLPIFTVMLFLWLQHS